MLRVGDVTEVEVFWNTVTALNCKSDFQTSFNISCVLFVLFSVELFYTLSSYLHFDQHSDIFYIYNNAAVTLLKIIHRKNVIYVFFYTYFFA